MLIPMYLRPKFIEGFDKEYGATRSGQVYSFIRGKFLQQIKNSRGYYQVRLCKDGKPAQYLVHRLVAQTYIPVPKYLQHISVEKLTIDHISGDKSNNSIQNLQWLTRGDNLRKGANKPVAMDTIPLIFSSRVEAAQWIYGNSTSASSINGHLKGKVKNCKGNTLHKCTEEELSILNEFKNWEE